MSKKLFKIILLSIFFFGMSFFASAQSLQDNPDYRQSVELKRQSELAFEEGDYQESTRLANEAVVYAEKSDEWIAMMLSKYKANSALKRVETRLQTATRLNAETNFPEAYTQGKSLYEQAYQLYMDENYLESYPLSIQAFEIMKVIEYVAPAPSLPAAYVVQNNPGDEDCFWKIAEYDFIYGDPWQWKVIYEANKDILQDPDNPDLINSDLVLTIPSLNGEIRRGTWKNGSIE